MRLDMYKIRSFVLLFFLINGLATWSFSQSTPADSLADLYVDFSVPDLAAFTLLGFNVDQVARPGNVKELSAALISAVGRGGRINQGMAVEWAPFQTFLRSKSLEDYQKCGNILARNVSLSYAAAKESTNTKVSIGLQWVLLDNSDILKDTNIQKRIERIFRFEEEQDPGSATKRSKFMNKIAPSFTQILLDQTQELDTALLNELLTLINPDISNYPPPNIFTIESVMRRLEEKLKEQNIELTPAQEDTLKFFSLEYIDMLKPISDYIIEPAVEGNRRFKLNNLIENWKKDHWNATTIQIGFGTIWNSLNSSLGELDADQFSSYLAGAFPLTRIGQLIFQGQYRKSYQEKAMEKWKYSLGSRLLLGNSDHRFSVEGLFSDSQNADSTLNGINWRVTIGTELKLSEGLWLEIATGFNIPQSNKGTTQIVTIGGIKYAFKRERRFSIR